MRYIGIDYGARRVGIALSDESGSVAFPHGVFENNPGLLDRVVAFARENKAGEIVIGESKNFRGEPNVIMSEITPFKKELEEKSGLPVSWEAEFMTSQAAERIQGKSEHLDASAAALILQSYLDKSKLKGKN